MTRTSSPFLVSPSAPCAPCSSHGASLLPPHPGTRYLHSCHGRPTSCAFCWKALDPLIHVTYSFTLLCLCPPPEGPFPSNLHQNVLPILSPAPPASVFPLATPHYGTMSLLRLPHKNMHSLEAGSLSCPALHIWHRQQCLGHSGCSVTIRCMNERLPSIQCTLLPILRDIKW